MYYSQQVIDEVIASVNIVDVVSRNVKITKRGSTYMGLCPFHKEKTPSFSVQPSKGIFHCFGCGTSGNTITFLMKYRNVSFPEALMELAQMGGVDLPEKEITEEEEKENRKKQLLLDINKAAAMYFFSVLRTKYGAEAYEYLSGRHLSDATMRSFGLGYADGCVCRYLRSKGYKDQDIIEAGLGRYSEKYGLQDVFWKRAMFPIQDVSGRVIGFGGRTMAEDKKIPKYLNSRETPVFDKGRNLYGLHLARKAGKGRIILCEGYMDVIAMHQAGFTEAVASLGTALTPMQAGIIRKYAKEVILSYDSDAAGQKACMKNIGILREAGLPSRVLHLEPYKDPDEFLKTLGAEEFEKRIKSAEVSFFYEVAVLAKDYDLSDPAAKAAYLQDIAVRLSAFRNSLERETYLAAICERFSISKEALSGIVTENIRQGEDDARKKDNYRDMYRSDMEKILAEKKGSDPGEETVLSSESKELAGRPASVEESLQEQERKGYEFENYIVIEALFSTKGKALFQEISKYISPEEFIGSMRPLAKLIWKAEGDWERYTPEEKKYLEESLVKLLQEKLDTWKPVGPGAVAAAFKDETIRMASEERREEEKIKKKKLIGILKGILPENW